MDETLDLRQIIEFLLKGKWIIAIVTIIAMLISAILSWFVFEERYRSEAVIQISGGVQDTGIMSNYVATEFTPLIYMQRIQNEALMREAFETAEYEKFNKDSLKVTNQENTNLVLVSYESSSIEESQKSLNLLLNEVKKNMNISVKENLNQLEQTYLKESDALSKEIENLMTEYNNIVIKNKLPEILILQTISSSQYVLTLTEQQTKTLSNITGTIQNQLLQLKAKIDTKNAEYHSVLAKYQSVKTGLDSFKPDPFIRVILEPTLPELAIFPNKLLNLILGLLVGFILSICIILFKENLRKSIS